MEVRLPDPGDALTGVDMFAALEHDVRQRVIAAAVPRTYRKGQLLFVENDPGESLIVLRRGAVMVFRTSPTGERAVLNVIRPPDTFGEVSLLDGSPRSASAEAIEDCQALALSRGAFLELVHANPRILDAVMRSLGGLIRRLTEQNADHVFLDLPGRVAKTLVRLAGDTQAPMVTIELNQSQLAEMAGGSRQSVNQAIGSFASRGWLRTEGRRTFSVPGHGECSAIMGRGRVQIAAASGSPSGVLVGPGQEAGSVVGPGHASGSASVGPGHEAGSTAGSTSGSGDVGPGHTSGWSSSPSARSADATTPSPSSSASVTGSTSTRSPAMCPDPPSSVQSRASRT